MPTPIAVTKAVSALRSAEHGAASGKESLYTGSGRDNNSPMQGKMKGKKKGGLAALAIILMLAIGGGAFLGSSNSMLAPAIEALFTEATDTQYASNVSRSATLMKYRLRHTDATTTSIFGTKYNKMSTSFKKRLKTQGIEVKGYGSGRKLVYTQVKADGTEIKLDVEADNFSKTFKENADFRESYTQAKRGRIASFFDNIAEKIYSKIGISRNKFRDYKQSGDSDADAKKYRETLHDDYDRNSTSIKTQYKDEQEYDLEDNNGKPLYDDGNGGTSIEPTNPDGSPRERAKGTRIVDVPDSETGTSNNTVEQAETKARTTVSKVAATVARLGNTACAIMKVGTMISAMVAANEIYQSIQYFLGLTENISKMKAGYGDESAVNEVLNFLSTPADVKVDELTNVKVTSKGFDSKGVEQIETEAATKDTHGTPLEANGIQMIMANAPALSNTNTYYSLERAGKSVIATFASRGVTRTVCSRVAIGTSIASIAITFATGGAATIAATIAHIALDTAISVTVGAAMGFLIPLIAKALFTNVFDHAKGLLAGEMYARGASAANTRLGRTGSGQSLSSKEAAVAYNAVNNEVLALDAEIERKNHSPFDISNKNTFFGSIAYSLLGTVTTNRSSSLVSLVRSTGSSLASLMTNVHADGEGTSYMTKFGNCPDLANIGAVGDIYCNPVTSTDTELLGMSPDNGTYIAKIEASMEADSCQDDGNCKIKDGSELAKYISYCDGRDSPFGVVDQNILGALQATSSLGVLGSFLGSIPIVGDVIEIINTLSDEKNEDWATGKKCVNSADNPYWDSDAKYYQRYVEDMRILDQWGAFEGGQSPVARYEAEYEAAHPTDDSYEGYLSRISGLTPENVETVLAFVDYYNMLEEYDASSTLALEADVTVSKTGSEVVAEIERFTRNDFADESATESLAGAIILAVRPEHIIYADLRGRSYIV